MLHAIYVLLNIHHQATHLLTRLPSKTLHLYPGVHSLSCSSPTAISPPWFSPSPNALHAIPAFPLTLVLLAIVGIPCLADVSLYMHCASRHDILPVCLHIICEISLCVSLSLCLFFSSYKDTSTGLAPNLCLNLNGLQSAKTPISK